MDEHKKQKSEAKHVTRKYSGKQQTIDHATSLIKKVNEAYAVQEALIQLKPLRKERGRVL